MTTSGRHRQWITFNFERLPFFRSNIIINYPLIKNEIYIKIGGDYGGGSFKMSFQVANVENLSEKITLLSSAFLRHKTVMSISSLLWNALKLK